MNGEQPDTIFLDNHSTTRVDRRVLDAMIPYFESCYGNAGSLHHWFGESAKDAVERSRGTIARLIGAEAREIVFTSGATESNNLALFGVAGLARMKGKHFFSAATEHRAVLDPLEQLRRRGFEITLAEVQNAEADEPGVLALETVERGLRDSTCLASVMLANNEIGVIQSLEPIAELCHQQGAVLHSDATQAVGKIPVDVERLGLDLMSFTAHKMHGPKGVGALYVRKRERRVRLAPQLVGGGQESGRRSGTLNVAGIVGFAVALELAVESMQEQTAQVRRLRDRLFLKLTTQIEGVTLNGPPLENVDRRLANNLNCSFAKLDGEALMLNLDRLAVSSGSACTSTDPNPSHVLRALAIDDDQVRSSLRFGLSRFTTEAEIDQAVEWIEAAVNKLRKLG